MEFILFNDETGESQATTVEEVSGSTVEVNFLELEVVAYVGELKIVGTAHFGHSGRASSQRSSDYLRRFAEGRLTLSRVRIFRHATGELIDTTSFTVINLDRVDLVYVREVEGAESGMDTADPKK